MKLSLYLCLITALTWVNLQKGFAQKAAFDNAQSKFTSGSWQIGLKGGYGRGDLFKNRNGVTGFSLEKVECLLIGGQNGVGSKPFTESRPDEMGYVT